MPELPVRTDDVDVERIMEQVRARIEDRRRRAAQRAREAAKETGARARIEDRRRRAAQEPADEEREYAAAALPPSVSFEFDENSIYWSSRGAAGRVLHGIRRLLRPLVKFVFNIDRMVHALVMQARLNAQQTAFDDDVARRLADRDEQDARRRETVQELAAEVRRLSAEMQSQRRLLESVAARLDAPAHAEPHGGRQADERAADAPAHAEPHGGRQADERADDDATAAPDDGTPAAPDAHDGTTAAPDDDETPPGGGAADAPAGGAAPTLTPPAAGARPAKR